MSIFSSLRHHAVISTVGGIAVVCIAVIAGRAATTKAPPANTSGTTLVTVVNVSTFRTGNLSVAGDGVVESHAQADLKSQISAPVALINVSIGDSVYAGETILELQNADIRAQLAQAQAGLIQAQGSYSSTRQGAMDKVRDAYLSADNVVHSQMDPLLFSAIAAQPVLYTYVTDPVLGRKISDERNDLTVTFKNWKPLVDQLSASSTDSDIHTALATSETNLASIRVLLDDMSSVFNDAASKALPSNVTTVTGLQNAVSGARTSINAAASSLTTAESNLTNSGSDSGSAASAQVSAAQAGVSNLQAQLAKTIVRSPISGKVSALPLREGELAAPGTLIATVIGNDSGLEIKAYVSGDDLSRVQVGAPVTIALHIQGRVSNIAPSVDAITRKAEVDIDVMNAASSGLVIGQNVSVSIAPLHPSTQSGTTLNQPLSYLLPIQDVKVIPGEAYVFTVDQDSKIKKNDVTVGQIQGDFIQVTAGLTDDMNIVTPVYELDPGQTVRVQ